MNIRTQKKRFDSLAKQLRNNTPMTDEQRLYLADSFAQIAQGADANEVFGIKYSKGKSDTKDRAKENHFRIIHWITAAILSEEEGGLGLNITQAIEAVSALMDGGWINPITKEKYVYKDEAGRPQSPFGCIYTTKNIKKIWDSRKNKHMKVVVTTSTAKDSPY
jgi:hypothetical protein